MAYADKRDGKHTGSFVGEAPKLNKKRRFKTLQDAKDYETFCKLMGREPPTVTEDGNPVKADGEMTYADLAKLAKAAGGPEGKWKRERDHSLQQRIDYGVGIIGAYGITRVKRSTLRLILDSLENRPASPGKRLRGPDATRKGLSNGTKNRYLSAASAVLEYAVNEELLEHRPAVPWLNEKDDRRTRDILNWGQEDVVLKLMREAGHEVEALCVEVLIETGLRSGELLVKARPEQVTFEHVEDEDGTSVLVGVLSLGIKQTKNDTCRSVIFSADLARDFKANLAAGTLPKADKLLDTFKEACERAGYTGNLVIHSLRHTRNTRLNKAGVEQAQRKVMLGHLSDEANDIYTHRDLEDQLKAVKKLRDYAGKRAARAKMPTSQVIDFVKAGAG